MGTLDIDNDDIMNLWFCNIEDIGSGLRKKLKSRFANIKDIFLASEDLLETIIGDRLARRLVESRSSDRVMEIKGRLDDRGIKFLYPEHNEYPEKLKQIYDYPDCLYVRGELKQSLNYHDSNVAIVGSRVASTYGREVAKNISRNLASNDINIISGLARGIDSMAHKGALMASGYTLAVLGCGINVTYPKENIDLFMEVEKHGAVISEYGLDVPPHPGLFPNRNRIISALADGVLVVEAKKKSGSLITVDYALEQGKQVYAVPGRLFDANSEGTNNLIKLGAMCVNGYEDIMSDLKGTSYENDYKKSAIVETENSNIREELKNDNKNFLAPIEKIVYSCLSLEPTYIDEIINKSGIGITKTISTLYLLEEKGVVNQPLKGYYIVAI